MQRKLQQKRCWLGLDTSRILQSILLAVSCPVDFINYLVVHFATHTSCHFLLLILWIMSPFLAPLMVPVPAFYFSSTRSCKFLRCTTYLFGNRRWLVNWLTRTTKVVSWLCMDSCSTFTIKSSEIQSTCLKKVKFVLIFENLYILGHLVQILK